MQVETSVYLSDVPTYIAFTMTGEESNSAPNAETRTSARALSPRPFYGRISHRDRFRRISRARIIAPVFPTRRETFRRERRGGEGRGGGVGQASSSFLAGRKFPTPRATASCKIMRERERERERDVTRARNYASFFDEFVFDATLLAVYVQSFAPFAPPRRWTPPPLCL